MTVRAIYKAGPAYGLGHKRRALTLARAVRQVPELRRKHVTILDYPGIEASTVRRLRERGQLVVVLGAEYRPDCTEWSEPSLQIIPAFPRVNPGSKGPPFLAGPDAAILGAEYRRLPPKDIRSEVRRLLVTLGGAAPEIPTSIMYDLWRLVWPMCDRRVEKVRIIIGPYARRTWARQWTWILRWEGVGEIVHAPRSLLDHLLWADCVLTAGGGTLCEVAATGTPAVVLVAGPDQEDNAAMFCEQTGAAMLGTSPTGPTLREALSGLTFDRRLAMSCKMQQRVDGCGTDRAVFEIMRVAGV